MKAALVNILALVAGVIIAYFLYHGIKGILLLLSIIFYVSGWLLLAFCIVCIITLPIMFAIWAIRSLLREILK